MEIKGSIILLMVLIFLQAICGMTYGKRNNSFDNHRWILMCLAGFLISSFCEEEVQVIQVAMGSVFPMLLSSGKDCSAENIPIKKNYLHKVSYGPWKECQKSCVLSVILLH